VRPNAFKLAFALAVFLTPPAPGGGAARAQLTPSGVEQAVGRESDYRPGREGFQLRGPVRTVKEDAFNLHGGGTKTFTGNMTFHFDERGRLVRLLMGNNHMEDLYDDRFSYRDDGRVSSKERHYDRRRESIDMYIYADDRRAVEVLTYNGEGALVMRLAKSFDELGGETRSEMEFMATKGVEAPDKRVTEMTHAYDEKGRLVTTTLKEADGRPRLVVTRRHEAGGRWVTTLKYPKDSVRPEAATVTTVTTLDARGELLSNETYSADGVFRSKVTYARKYDARGNWVEEVIRTQEHAATSAQESSFLRRRTITYF
jgi:hypothetical protein